MLYPRELSAICVTITATSCSSPELLTAPLPMPGSLGQAARCFLAKDSGRATGGKKGGCQFLRCGKTAHFRGHKGMYISAWLTHLSSQKCSLTARCSRPCADTVTRSRHRGCAFNRGNSPLAHCFLQQSLSKRLQVFF